jgi:hypothetical protein
MRARERASSFNIIPVMKAPALPIRRRIAAVCLGAFVPLLAWTVFAADPVGTPPTEEPKTHVLFMGADISVEQGRMLHPLVDATDLALIVQMDGKPLEIPHRRVTDIRLKDVLKLSATSVGIDDLKAERAYAEGSDPFDSLVRSSTFAAGEVAAADMAMREGVKAETAAAVAGAAVASAGTPQDRAAASQALAQAQNRQAAAQQAAAQSLQSANFGSSMAERHQAAAGEDLFDAIRFSFEVHADRDLKQPYYALVAVIREKDSRTKEAFKWTYVKPLGPIAAGGSRKVRALQGGLPPGYVLESWEVHVYDGGEELATNLSRKRVEVTAEEAREFQVIEHIASNRGRTLPASVLDPVLVTAAREALSPAQAGRTWHVRVNKAGRVSGVFLDADGKQPTTDTAVVAVLKTLRFKPALAAGKAVESMVALQLKPNG